MPISHLKFTVYTKKPYLLEKLNKIQSVYLLHALTGLSTTYSYLFLNLAVYKLLICPAIYPSGME